MEQATHKRAPWGPIAAILGTLLIFFGSQLIVGILASTVLTLMGWDSAQIEAWFAGGNQSQFIINVLIRAVTLILLFWYLAAIKAHPRDIGLIRPKLRDVGYILLGALIYVLSFTVLEDVLTKLLPGLDADQRQDLGFQAASGNELFYIFISLVILAPIVEEIVVRGFLFTGLRAKLSFLLSAILSSALFGLGHLLGGENGSLIWIATIDTFILGLVLSFLREKTGGLTAPIGLHALKNGLAFLALFVFGVV